MNDPDPGLRDLAGPGGGQAPRARQRSRVDEHPRPGTVIPMTTPADDTTDTTGADVRSVFDRSVESRVTRAWHQALFCCAVLVALGAGTVIDHL